MKSYIEVKRTLEAANISIGKLNDLVSDAITISRTSMSFVEAVKNAFAIGEIEKAIFLTNILQNQICQEYLILERMDARLASMKGWIK